MSVMYSRTVHPIDCGWVDHCVTRGCRSDSGQFTDRHLRGNWPLQCGTAAQEQAADEFASSPPSSKYRQLRCYSSATDISGLVQDLQDVCVNLVQFLGGCSGEAVGKTDKGVKAWCRAHALGSLFGRFQFATFPLHCLECIGGNDNGVLPAEDSRR